METVPGRWGQVMARCAVRGGTGAATVVLLLAGGGRVLDAGPARTVIPEDFVIVVDDTANPGPTGAHGCDEVLVIDSQTGSEIGRSHWRYSPGQLAATSEGGVILSVFNNDPGAHTFVRVMVRLPGGSPRWTSHDVGIAVVAGGAIAVSPDDSIVLLLVRQREVEKHLVADITPTSLGRPVGVFAGARAAEIEFSPDSATAYIVDTDGEVHLVDVETMKAVRAPIPYTPVMINNNARLRNTFGSVSPDGRYLVINTGGPQLNVVDLVQRRSVLIDAPELQQTRGLAFDYASAGENLLAVHGHTAVAVYRFHGTDPLDLLARTALAGQEAPQDDFVRVRRVDTLAWTGRGDGVIAAIAGAKEFRILDWLAGPPGSLRRRLDFDACGQTWRPAEFGYQIDVLTLNNRDAPPTATTTATPEPATPTPTPTATMTPTVSPTPTATLTPTSTSTPTRVPQPVYLPLALKEDCLVGQQRVDVALVIDASTSMQEPTRQGRTKLAAAIDAVGLFLDQLDLPHDQAAIVEFNGGVRLLAPLTGDRGLLADGLGRIAVQQQTRIDLGVETAHQELASANRRAGNEPVIIVLTDGRANPVGPEVAVAKAAAAKDDGITIFTIGLGEELDEWALAAMASKRDYYYRAPDGEDLKAIYQAIAVEIPCPAGGFWGRRIE